VATGNWGGKTTAPSLLGRINMKGSFIARLGNVVCLLLFVALVGWGSPGCENRTASNGGQTPRNGANNGGQVNLGGQVNPGNQLNPGGQVNNGDELNFRVVMLEDEPGYELHMGKNSAEKLRNLVNNEFLVNTVGELLEGAAERGSQAAGIPPKAAELFAKFIGKLYSNNVEKFKEEMSAKMGRAGIILTIKPNTPWVVKNVGGTGINFDILDPSSTLRNAGSKALQSLLKKTGNEKIAETLNNMKRRYREFMWASETPLTVLIDSNTWSIRPRNTD
jgi:hypothetical protein